MTLTELLIEGSKSIGLTVIEGKTKFMILSRKNNSQQSPAVNGMLFEKVNNSNIWGGIKIK